MSFDIQDYVRISNPAVEPDTRQGEIGLVLGQFKGCYAVKLDDGNNHHWFGEDELQAAN
jgi:hypothetical protein